MDVLDGVGLGVFDSVNKESYEREIAKAEKSGNMKCAETLRWMLDCIGYFDPEHIGGPGSFNTLTKMINSQFKLFKKALKHGLFYYP